MLRRLLSFLLGETTLEGRSPKWSAERAAWLAEHGECEACGGKEALEVHHCLPVSYYPELELDRSNFMTLCDAPLRLCHLLIGHSGNWRGYNPHCREDAALMRKRRQERKHSR